MEIIQEEEQESRDTRVRTLADRIKDLESKERLSKRSKESKDKTREFKFPFRWMMKFNQSRRRSKTDMMLVLFLNKKNEIEAPKFMPIFDGNMIVWKNKPYEFDPRAIWTIKGVKKNPRVYLIKEIDRRPVRNKDGKVIYGDASVSNMDLDEIRERGDSTESDEFLIKTALRAQITQNKKAVNIVVLVILAIIVIGGLIWFLRRG